MARRVIAVSGPDTAPPADGHVRVLCAHNPRIWKTSRDAGYDLVLAGHLHGCQLVACEYRDRLFPGALFYPYCFLSHQRGFDTAGGQPRRQRSPADPLAVPPRSGAVPCLTGPVRHQVSLGRVCQPRIGHVSAARSSALLSRGTQNAIASPGHRRARHTSSCFAIRSHCRARESASWPLFMDFQGVHQRGVGSQGSVRGRMPRDPAAAGAGRPGLCVEEYLGRLRDLESRRPSIGGDHRRFDEVRLYREGVARLSLATAAAIALNAAVATRTSARLIATAMSTRSFGS